VYKDGGQSTEFETSEELLAWYKVFVQWGGCSVQAAREIAATLSTSSNRVFLNADSLLLNLVGPSL
jgi:hypothetical protein